MKMGQKRTELRKAMKKRVPKNYYLDNLYNKIVKYLANYTCELCGIVPTNPKKYHTHHFITRSVIRLRWVFENTICVCAGCHDDLEKDPKFNTEVFTKRLGTDRLDELRRQRHTLPKVDRIQLEQELQEKLKMLEI